MNQHISKKWLNKIFGEFRLGHWIGLWTVSLTVCAMVIIAIFTSQISDIKERHSRELINVRETFQNAYRDNYYKLLQLLLSAGLQYLELDDLHEPIWLSNELKEQLKPLEKLSLMLNEMRKQLVINQLVTQDDLDDIESPQYRFAMARFLNFAVTEGLTDWSIVGDDVYGWINRHKELIESKDEYKHLEGANFYLHGKIAQYHSARMAMAGDTSGYQSRTDNAISYFRVALEKRGGDAPWLPAITNMVECYSTDYCIDPESSKLDEIVELYSRLPKPSMSVNDSLTNEAKSAISHQLNMLELEISKGRLTAATTILGRLLQWEKNNRDYIGQSGIWALHQKAILTYELILRFIAQPYDMVTGDIKIRQDTLLSLRRTYDSLVNFIHINNEEYTNDMAWLYYHKAYAIYLQSKNEELESRLVEYEICEKIRSKRDQWYFSIWENYPKLLLRQFEADCQFCNSL